MTSSSTVATLVPAIDVLATCLTRASENYQQLTKHTESYALCTEVGRSTRHLAECYSRVLCAALGWSSETAEDGDNWDGESQLHPKDDLDFE